VSQDMIILLLIWLYLYIKSELVLPFGFR
jgi:hypothetical protein